MNRENRHDCISLIILFAVTEGILACLQDQKVHPTDIMTQRQNANANTIGAYADLLPEISSFAMVDE